MQDTLFRLLQSWQNELEKSGSIGTILMQISKASDCLSHDLLITKLEIYDVEKRNILNTNQYIPICINTSFNDWHIIFVLSSIYQVPVYKRV